MMEDLQVPAKIAALAESAGGVPISWNDDYEDRTVIVFQDGRKMSFPKGAARKPVRANTAGSAAVLDRNAKSKKKENE